MRTYQIQKKQSPIRFYTIRLPVLLQPVTIANSQAAPARPILTMAASAHRNNFNRYQQRDAQEQYQTLLNIPPGYMFIVNIQLYH